MKYAWAVVIILVSTFFLIAAAVENKGAEQITIDGGERGAVAFPHHQHQNRLGDCNICHSLFPQEPHAIEQLKKEGKLIKKQVMNKLCVKCHKAEKRAGNKAGPTICSKCHQRG